MHFLHKLHIRANVRAHKHEKYTHQIARHCSIYTHQYTMAVAASKQLTEWSYATTNEFAKEEELSVFVHGMGNKTLVLHVGPKLPISDILDIVVDRYQHLDGAESLQKSDLYLTYQGKVLADEACLLDYGILKDNAVITANFRLEGGCFLATLLVLSMCILALLLSFCTGGASLLVLPVLIPLLIILPMMCL